MNLVIDMNLSPEWVSVLAGAGHVVAHWSTIGAVNATDHEILMWARRNAHIVFTHDLDFGAILASTAADAWLEGCLSCPVFIPSFLKHLGGRCIPPL